MYRSSRQLEVIVTMKEDDKEADDRRRFKVQFALANVIDLNSLAEFCRGEKQNEKTKETMVSLYLQMELSTWIIIVARRDPSHERSLPPGPYQQIQIDWCSRSSLLHYWQVPLLLPFVLISQRGLVLLLEVVLSIMGFLSKFATKLVIMISPLDLSDSRLLVLLRFRSTRHTLPLFSQGPFL